MSGLFDAIVSEERNKSQELIKNSLEKLKASKIDFSNPERFNGYLVYKLNNGLKEIANTMHDAPLKGIKDTYKPDFIYLNYDFLEHNIRELCELREGSCCCADKSRSILQMYLKYSLTGEIPEFNPDIENYWTPNFGTHQEWIDLCDALYHLYYGKTEQYFRAYNALIQTEIRRYKHILHTWYIKFKDGQVVKFNDTWDDKQENPLNNEYFDKGDYYVVYRKFVKNRNYEIYQDKDFMRNHYCKVPKIDIDEIYKVSEEKMM
jgi:hypothetical protein